MVYNNVNITVYNLITITNTIDSDRIYYNIDK